MSWSWNSLKLAMIANNHASINPHEERISIATGHAQRMQALVCLRGSGFYAFLTTQQQAVQPNNCPVVHVLKQLSR